MLDITDYSHITKFSPQTPQTSQSLTVSQSVPHFGRNLKNADKIYSVKKLADSLIGTVAGRHESFSLSFF